MCCRALGLDVHVLGGPISARLRRSRHCSSFHRIGTDVDGRRDEGLAAEINALAQRLSVDMLLAGDATQRGP